MVFHAMVGALGKYLQVGQSNFELASSIMTQFILHSFICAPVATMGRDNQCWGRVERIKRSHAEAALGTATVGRL